MSILTVQPALSRRIRSKLNREAEKEAIDVFSKNLREMLLEIPNREVNILGMDPGKILLLDLFCRFLVKTFF